MRQLDTCDFCGDAAAGVYEVVPASVAGEARRLALCADCRETLGSVLDPLLDAAEGGTDAADASRADPKTSDSEHDERAAETADPDASSESEPDLEPAAGAEDAVTFGASRRAGDVDSDDEEEKADETATEAEQQRKPQGYGQVIRLLQNRDGAMPRADLRALATNAYDLDASTFEDAVDAAVENGDVEETGSGLRTT